MTASASRCALALALTAVCTATARAWLLAQASVRADTQATARTDARPQGTGSLRGRVVDGATGQPLRDVRLTALWQQRQGRPVDFETVSDGQGMFTFDALPDGVYVVWTFRQGYHPPAGDSSSPRHATLTGGGTVDLGDVRVLRGGVITGRVLDIHGEPVVGARVSPVGRLRGMEPLTSLGGMATTDDRGVYRLHGLTPARYTVRAVPLGPSARGPVRLQGDEPEPLPAFATAASEPSAAEFVEVRAGEEAVLDVRLAAGRLASVSGRIVFESEPPTELRPNVSLRAADHDAQLQLAQSRAELDGRFSFLDVAPGRYRVVAEEPTVITPDGQARHRAGWLDVTVTGEPVSDLLVTVGFGAVVRGRIEIDGGDPTALRDRPLQAVSRTVSARTPLQSSVVSSSSTTDLAFELRDVLGTRQLEVAGLPPGWWLKAVLIDGEDATDGHTFPVSGTVDGVVLLVSGSPSGVTGRVQGTAGLLQGASVLTLPVDRPAAAQGPFARRIASVSIDGRFTAQALRPGRYVTLALSPAMRSRYDRMDSDERDALHTSRGRLVDVVEGRLAEVMLQLVEH